VVIVPVTEPKVRGFKASRGRWVFNGGGNTQHEFIRTGSKAVGPCRKILRHVKDPCGVRQRFFAGKVNGHFRQVSSCFATRCFF
jgi:hypothetical protein